MVDNQPSATSSLAANWPTALIQEIAERRCIIVIGAGLSAQSQSALNGSHPPSWASLVEQLAKICFRRGVIESVQRKIDASSLLDAVVEIRKHVDPQTFDRALAEILVDPVFEPTECHDYIIELDQQVVISLNFDSIYEDQCERGNPADYRVTSPVHGDLGRHVRGPSKAIYKLHGSVRNPNSLIFDTKDYIRNAEAASTDLKVIEALLLTRTALFVGCGFNGDPDVELMLEKLGQVGGAPYPHFALVRSPMDGDDPRPNLNGVIQWIEYGGTPEAPHAGFVDSLRELAHDVRERRRLMA